MAEPTIDGRFTVAKWKALRVNGRERDRRSPREGGWPLRSTDEALLSAEHRAGAAREDARSLLSRQIGLLSRCDDGKPGTNHAAWEGLFARSQAELDQEVHREAATSSLLAVAGNVGGPWGQGPLTHELVIKWWEALLIRRAIIAELASAPTMVIPSDRVTVPGSLLPGREILTVPSSVALARAVEDTLVPAKGRFTVGAERAGGWAAAWNRQDMQAGRSFVRALCAVLLVDDGSFRLPAYDELLTMLGATEHALPPGASELFDSGTEVQIATWDEMALPQEISRARPTAPSWAVTRLVATRPLEIIVAEARGKRVKS